MAKRFNPKTMPDEPALEVIRRTYGLEGAAAKEALAIMRGESDGDVIEAGPSDKAKRIIKRRKEATPE